LKEDRVAAVEAMGPELPDLTRPRDGWSYYDRGGHFGLIAGVDGDYRDA
jgi:hypothetical protein